MCIRDRVYTVYNQYLKRYTACQVAYIAPPDTVSKEPWAVVLSLDWVGDAPLTAEELPQLRPLYKDFMYWPRDLHLLRVPVEIPPQYTLVGTLPSFTDQPCRSYGGWDDGYDVYLHIRWQEIPEERRRAFKAVSYTHLALDLIPGDYGRAICNGRCRDWDTGIWYYVLDILNVMPLTEPTDSLTSFMDREPNKILGCDRFCTKRCHHSGQHHGDHTVYHSQMCIRDRFKGIIFEELIQRWCFFCVIFYVCV